MSVETSSTALSSGAACAYHDNWSGKFERGRVVRSREREHLARTIDVHFGASELTRAGYSQAGGATPYAYVHCANAFTAVGFRNDHSTRILAILGQTLKLVDALKLVFLCKTNRTCSIMMCCCLNLYHHLRLLIAHLLVYGEPTIPSYAPSRPCGKP